MQKHGTRAAWQTESQGEHEETTPSAPDANRGAIEGDRPTDEQQGNSNVPALDSEGQPADWKKICEDVIGANDDDSQG